MPTGLSLARAAQEAADVQFVVEVMQTEGVTRGWGGPKPWLESDPKGVFQACCWDGPGTAGGCTKHKGSTDHPFAEPVNFAVMLGAAGPAPSFFHSNQRKCALVLKSGASGLKSLMAFLGFFPLLFLL